MNIKKIEIAKAIAEFYSIVESYTLADFDETRKAAHILLTALDKYEVFFSDDLKIVRDANLYRKSVGICTVCCSQIGTGEECEACIQYNKDQTIERDIDKRREIT